MRKYFQDRLTDFGLAPKDSDLSAPGDKERFLEDLAKTKAERSAGNYKS